MNYESPPKSMEEKNYSFKMSLWTIIGTSANHSKVFEKRVEYFCESFRCRWRAIRGERKRARGGSLQRQWKRVKSGDIEGEMPFLVTAVGILHANPEPSAQFQWRMRTLPVRYFELPASLVASAYMFPLPLRNIQGIFYCIALNWNSLGFPATPKSLCRRKLHDFKSSFSSVSN